jgi:hypothetical protein
VAEVKSVIQRALDKHPWFPHDRPQVESVKEAGPYIVRHIEEVMK